MQKPEIDLDMYADLIHDADQPQVTAHAAAVFCSNACRHDYREERLGEILLPLHECEGKMIHYLDMCAKFGQCAYCREPVRSQR
jgi:hypothetical protein